MDDLAKLILRRDFDGAIGLLRRGADPNKYDKRLGTYPLHLAVVKGDLPLVAEMLNNGADVAVRDDHGNTAIEFALRGIKSSCVDDVNKVVDAICLLAPRYN